MTVRPLDVIEGGTVLDRVKFAMRGAGLSQAALGERINLGPDKVSKSFTGKRRFSSLEFALISEATGVSVDWMLGITSDIDSALQAQNGRMRDAIWKALDYSADTSKGDWQISYHEAVQWMRQILDEAWGES